MDATVFGTRLRAIRTDAGLTQKELAETAGLTAAGVAQLEQGRREPTWRSAVALAAALGVALDDFARPPGNLRPRRSK